jgi:uncharacterized protein YqhQ
MALQNGVLVSGPTSWAATVRLADGSLKTATGVVPRARSITVPLVRGPVRLAESLALLPAVKRALPEARFSFERPTVAVAIAAGMVGAAAARRSPLPLPAREAAAALAGLVPAVLSLRAGELTSYHGAEHVAIGSYEAGERHAKEHERCGSHLIGPLVLTSAVASAFVTRTPRRTRPLASAVGAAAALGVSVELFGWMTRNPERRTARLLARPGHELQARLSTAEPNAAQLEVAETALIACLEAEASSSMPA